MAKRRKARRKRRGLGFHVFRLLFAALALAVAWTLYVQYRIHTVEETALPDRVDAGIVLGAALWKGKPSPGLRERLDRAYELYAEGAFGHFIVSGGYDYAGSPMTEAEGMRDYLMSLGVPESHIVLENEATNTYENIRFSQSLMKERGWTRAVIVTHAYHGARALDIASFLGMERPAVAVTASSVMNMTYHKARETLAFTKWTWDKQMMYWGFVTPDKEG